MSASPAYRDDFAHLGHLFGLNRSQNVVSDLNCGCPLHTEVQQLVAGSRIKVDAISGDRQRRDFVDKGAVRHFSDDSPVRWTGKVRFGATYVNENTRLTRFKPSFAATARKGVA